MQELCTTDVQSSSPVWSSRSYVDSNATPATRSLFVPTRKAVATASVTALDSPIPSGDGRRVSCIGEQMAKMMASVLPEQVGILMHGSKVYQLASGLQVVCKSATSNYVISLLPRWHPWMRHEVRHHVDALTK